jgi:glucose/mannose transport system substrate-binding protein
MIVEPQVYKKQNPEVEIINAPVAGGAGFAARSVLQTRLAGGKPPDSWQTHPGRELLDQYVRLGYCEAITELYKSRACIGRWATHRPPSRRAESVADAGANPTVVACAIQSAARADCYEALLLM